MLRDSSLTDTQGKTSEFGITTEFSRLVSLFLAVERFGVRIEVKFASACLKKYLIAKWK